MNKSTIKSEVKKRYAMIARGGGCCGGPPCADKSTAESPMVSYGKIAEHIVEGANLGLGCGTPTQYAQLKSGETVLDLGSGAGVDVFIAAQAVGPEGHVVGVDMTAEMIELAKNNAVKGGYGNVEFRLGDIESLPVDNNSIDVVISNCVITLSLDKRRVFDEIYRVLKTGGRFSISDIVTHGIVPEKIRQDVAMWAGCVGGAMDQDEYLQVMRDAGFEEVHISQVKKYDYPKGADYGFASITVEGHKP